MYLATKIEILTNNIGTKMKIHKIINEINNHLRPFFICTIFPISVDDILTTLKKKPVSKINKSTKFNQFRFYFLVVT